MSRAETGERIQKSKRCVNQKVATPENWGASLGNPGKSVKHKT